jgi:putative peptidoglycan lipid II flippase
VSLYRNFLSVGGMTLLSRVLGFFRDMLMAMVLGTGPAADAFFAAFRFPNLFRRLFAEGAFNTAFVPMFATALERDGDTAARDLAARILAWLITTVVLVTLVFELFMEHILVPFVPGFLADPHKYELTVLLTRIMFPYLTFMSVMAAYAAMLNSLGRYMPGAFAPVLLNVVSIAALVPLFFFVVEDPETAAIWVSVAMLIGGVAQLALVYEAIRRAGFLPRFVMPKPDADIRRFWILAVPAILTGGITQINIFVGTIIASSAAGAIAILAYADRLYQLPLGIIGIAIGTVLLPELSRHIGAGRTEEAHHAQSQALILAMYLSVPSAVALAVIAEPIVRALFERGQFGPDATLATSSTLVAFALGLPAFVLVRVLQPGFFARKDTRTPTINAAITAAANVVLSLLLFPVFVQVGIALATTISSWLGAILLGIELKRRGLLHLPLIDLRRHAMILLSSAIMGAVLFGLAVWAGPWLIPGAGFWRHAGALLALVVVGAATYFLCAHVTGAQNLRDLARLIRRRPE